MKRSNESYKIQDRLERFFFFVLAIVLSILATVGALYLLGRFS